MRLLSPPDKIIKAKILLPASKSISNRLLIIQALSGGDFTINNLSNADDTVCLKKNLERIKSNSTNSIIDSGEGGTTFRFLLAYLSFIPGNFILTCSERMQQRPVKELVEALRQVGANIAYLEREDHPPLEIKGGGLKGGNVEIDSSVSSQFVSALLLVAPMFKEAINIALNGNIVSASYIKMTIRLMHDMGANVVMDKKNICVLPSPYKTKNIVVEGDWTAASYWYSIAALSNKAEIFLEGLKADSLQGDALLPKLFERFNVHTEFVEGGIVLKKGNARLPEKVEFDLSDNPDIAQTIALVCAALKIPAKLSGLKTLKVKETDRLFALKCELEKFSVVVNIIDDDLLEILPHNFTCTSATINTYKDHRMAMAFAPLALLCNDIDIEDPSVVSKSYPAFWDDLKMAGFTLHS